MGWFDTFATNLGNQSAPFGPMPGYDPRQAGINMLGSVGMNMLANNTENPMAALGKGYQAAQQQNQEQQFRALQAQEMMQGMDERKRRAARENTQLQNELEQQNAWRDFTTQNADKFGEYAGIAPFLTPKEGMDILAGLKPNFTPMTPEEKAAYGFAPDAPAIMTKDGPKVLEGGALDQRIKQLNADNVQSQIDERKAGAAEKTQQAQEASQSKAAWKAYATKNAKLFGPYAEIAPYLSPKEGMDILAGMQPDFRPMTPEEKSAYGLSANEPAVMTKEGPKVLKGSQTTVNIDNGKLTEVQSKDINFYSRGKFANRDLLQNENSLLSLSGSVAGQAGTVGNYFKDPKYRQAERAGREVLAVLLRKDTGAAVTPAEFELYGPMYLPWPGDDAQTVADKRQARERALNAIKLGGGTAGPLFDKVDQDFNTMFPDAGNTTAPDAAQNKTSSAPVDYSTMPIPQMKATVSKLKGKDLEDALSKLSTEQLKALLDE